MERRNFIKTAILGAMAGAVQISENTIIAATKTKTDDSQNDLVAVMGAEPEELYKRGIAAMGGMERFVKKGQKVVVKPNIGWDRVPELAANTNPELVAAVVKDCLAAGASEVVVFDHTCDQWESCYKNSGISEAAEKAGARIAFAHDKKYYRELELPKAKKLKKIRVHEEILDCDLWINIPILKNHGGAKMTIAMKNFMGIVWNRKFWHINNLQQCIADCATMDKMPALNIVDAYRIMTENGPKGISIGDVQIPKAIFMSTDIVAVDAVAVKFFSQYKDMAVENVSHIGLAASLGVGTTNLENLKIQRIKI